MLVGKVLMALSLLIFEFCFPSPVLHYSPGPENGIFIAVISIDMIGIGNKVGIIDIPPLIPVTDTGYVPGSASNASGNKLRELYCFGHRLPPFKCKKATCPSDRSPYELGFISFFGLLDGGGAIIIEKKCLFW